MPFCLSFSHICSLLSDFAVFVNDSPPNRGWAVLTLNSAAFSVVNRKGYQCRSADDHQNEPQCEVGVISRWRCWGCLHRGVLKRYTQSITLLPSIESCDQFVVFVQRYCDGNLMNVRIVGHSRKALICFGELIGIGLADVCFRIGQREGCLTVIVRGCAQAFGGSNVFNTN